MKYTDEFGIKYIPETGTECFPGSPCFEIFFTTYTYYEIPISIINPQSSSNLFDLSMIITKAITASDIVSSIVEEYKHIKGK